MTSHYDQVRRQVFKLLLQCGQHGATDCELYPALGLNRDTVRPCRCEFRELGLIVDSGRTRKSPAGKPCKAWVPRPGVTMASELDKPKHSAHSEGSARPASSTAAMPPAVAPVSSTLAMVVRCRCGSTEFVDVVLKHFPHNGESARRDCARCGHTVNFPIWYGELTGDQV